MMQYHYVSFIYQLQQKHVIKKCIKFLMREYIINIYNIKINSYKNIYIWIFSWYGECVIQGDPWLFQFVSIAKEFMQRL